MPAMLSVKSQLATLRTEFADLAYLLERQGRRDAADVVMMLDTRVREMMEEIATAGTGQEPSQAEPATTAAIRRFG